MRCFETEFIEEATTFIASIDQKTIIKMFYNIDHAEQANDPKLFRNYKMIFGNYGRNLHDFKSDVLLFANTLTTSKQ